MEEIKQILVNNKVLSINQENKNSGIIWITMTEKFNELGK